MGDVYNVIHQASPVLDSSTHFEIISFEESPTRNHNSRPLDLSRHSSSSSDGVIEIGLSAFEVIHELSSHSGRNSEFSSSTTVYVEGYVGGKSSIYGASFNFINSIIGAGIIGIPYAMKVCGFYCGVVMLITVAVLVDQSVIMLIECGIKAGKYDFEELTLHLLGPTGYYTAAVFMFLFAYGAQIAYMVIIGDTVPIVLANIQDSPSAYTSREFIMITFATVIVLPLCLLKNLSSLAGTSFLSVLSDVVLVFIIVCISVPEANRQGLSPGFQGATVFSPTIFAGIGTIAFAFVCQHNCFMVFRSLKQPSLDNWRRVAHLSIGFSLSISLLLCVVGYLSFKESTNGDILTNFPTTNTAVNVARVLLALCMTFVFPMECYVSRHCLLSAFSRVKQGPIPLASFAALSQNTEPSSESPGASLEVQPYVRILVSLVLWSTSVAIAVASGDLGDVLAITGSLAASVLGFILPGVVYIKSNESELRQIICDFRLDVSRENFSGFRLMYQLQKFYLPVFMIIFGSLLLVIGVSTVLFSSKNDE